MDIISQLYDHLHFTGYKRDNYTTSSTDVSKLLRGALNGRLYPPFTETRIQTLVSSVKVGGMGSATPGTRQLINCFNAEARVSDYILVITNSPPMIDTNPDKWNVLRSYCLLIRLFISWSHMIGLSKCIPLLRFYFRSISIYRFFGYNVDLLVSLVVLRITVRGPFIITMSIER